MSNNLTSGFKDAFSTENRPSPGYGKSPLLRNADGSINLDQFKKRPKGQIGPCGACTALGRAHRCGHMDQNRPNVQIPPLKDEPEKGIVSWTVSKDYVRPGETVTTFHHADAATHRVVTFKDTTSEDISQLLQKMDLREKIHLIETNEYVQYSIVYKHFVSVTRLLKEKRDDTANFLRCLSRAEGMKVLEGKVLRYSKKKLICELPLLTDKTIHMGKLVEISQSSMGNFIRFMDKILEPGVRPLAQSPIKAGFSVGRPRQTHLVPYYYNRGYKIIDHRLYESIREDW